MEKDDSEDYDMETNLSCPNCGAYVEVYRPNYDHEDFKEYTKNLESDGVVVPSRTPDAPWLRKFWSDKKNSNRN